MIQVQVQELTITAVLDGLVVSGGSSSYHKVSKRHKPIILNKNKLTYHQQSQRRNQQENQQWSWEPGCQGQGWLCTGQLKLGVL